MPRATATPSSTEALYLPKAWTDDPARLASAHVPSDVSFATKPRIAVQMIKRALAANVPFAWVAADTVYGVGEVEQVLRRAGRGYVLGVAGAHRFHSWGKGKLIAGAPRRSPLPAQRQTGNACRPVPGPRGRACTSGATWNSPT